VTRARRPRSALTPRIHPCRRDPTTRSNEHVVEPVAGTERAVLGPGEGDRAAYVLDDDLRERRRGLGREPQARQSLRLVPGVTQESRGDAARERGNQGVGGGIAESGGASASTTS
jgi:hypothetical protein